jgi:hypothetical protein
LPPPCRRGPRATNPTPCRCSREAGPRTLPQLALAGPNLPTVRPGGDGGAIRNRYQRRPLPSPLRRRRARRGGARVENHPSAQWSLSNPHRSSGVICRRNATGGHSLRRTAVIFGRADFVQRGGPAFATGFGCGTSRRTSAAGLSSRKPSILSWHSDVIRGVAETAIILDIRICSGL